MKQLISICCVALISLLSFQNALGTEPSPPPNGNSSYIKLKPKKRLGAHAPSLIYIECEYGEGYVQFSFPEGIYSVNVTLSNDSYVWTGYASRDYPKMEIPVLTGEYTIKCEANDGRIFYGTLEFAESDDYEGCQTA